MQTRNPIALGFSALGLVLVLAVSAQAATIYVDKDATGPTHDGSSWCNAYLTARGALIVATPGTTICVANGTYAPDQGGGATPGDRSATLQLKNGVTLLGSYAGCGAHDPGARDIAIYETILTGDLNGDDAPVGCAQNSPDCDAFGSLCVDGFCIRHDNNAENSYHVVTGSGTDATAVIDGFTIAAGNASASFPKERGGGMYNNGGSPTVTNCTFRGNSTNDEFGIGGGMYNGNSSPTVTNCTFSENSAKLGGGMYNWGSSNPTVANCLFSVNSAVNSGGGMNSQTGSNPTVTDCSFGGNSAGVGGAGMINWDRAIVTNCTFSGNSTGGGMANFLGNPTVTNCTFSGNSTGFHGGGMQNFSSNPAVTNCSFDGNLAGSAGGGMYNFRSSPIVTNCTFSGNSSVSHGGGIFNARSSPTAINCTFNGNSSGTHGGGIHNVDSSSATLTNCTISANSATDNGGGMYNQNDSNPTVINSIFWSNSDVSGIGQSSQIHTYSGTPVVNYSIVQGGWSGAGGVGVLDADPLFVGADGPDGIPGTEDDDLRLMPGSPAIDAGDNAALTVSTDLDGNSRTVDGDGNGTATVDMGAYEFFFPDCNGNGLPDDCDLDCLGGKGTCGVPGCGQSSDIDANGIPDECETGACCDGSNGFCADDVSMALCTGDERSWSVNTLCAELDPRCAGACCDHLTGGCTENVPPSACSETQQRWTGGTTCNGAVCEAVTGACCDHDPFGGCTDGLTRAECNCGRCEWTKRALCDDVDCPHDSIPTVGAWGLAILTLLLLTGAKIRFGRRLPLLFIRNS